MPGIYIQAGPRGITKPVLNLRMMNAVQGWHEGYIDRDEAKFLAAVLLKFAETGEQPEHAISHATEIAIRSKELREKLKAAA